MTELPDARARYPELLRRTAEQALSVMQPKPADDAMSVSVLVGQPAACVLADVGGAAELMRSLLDDAAHVLGGVLADDGMLATPAPERERRPVYFPWVVGLVFRAARRSGVPSSGHEALHEFAHAWHYQLAARGTEHYGAAQRSAVTLCEAVALAEAACWADQPAWVEPAQWRVHAVLSRTGKDGALQPVAEGESLDAWTYRELVGVHALHRLGALLPHSAWRARVRDAVTYHLGHTQPDNATTQPWGMVAFLEAPGDASGIGFADQQLHDAMMQGGGTLHAVAAMLVADAADTLGRERHATPE